jgi:hypothetical protein
MIQVDDAGDLLDAHWAVAVFEPGDRKEMLAFAEQVRRQLLAGTWSLNAEVPEQLLPLSSAYELAARERLDLFGLGHPSSPATAEQRAERARFVDLGARRAFDLGVSIPLGGTDAGGALYQALLLAALGTVAGRDTEYRGWLSLHRDRLFEAVRNEDWALEYLRGIVELWTEVLQGAGPSGLDRAMEIVATIRENRPAREKAALAKGDESAEMTLRFFFFALHHLTDAATELLLYRLHGEPVDVRQRLFVALSLAGEATAGDARIHSALDWLFEAAIRIAARRTPQLDLLPGSATRATTRAH